MPILSYSQICTDIKELFRKRHTISGMTYGHPYTMFDGHPSTSDKLPHAGASVRSFHLLKVKNNNE